MHATAPHRRLVALALAGLLTTSCVTTQLPPVSSTGAAFQPTPDEVELWNDARLEEVQLRSAVALYQDAALESYLDRVADRLNPPGMAANPHLRFEVWVVDDPTLNAFAYPHGPLYLHTGLLARMENEAQLATVVAHEMSHVEYRHMLRYRRALQNREVALLTAAVAAEILLAGEEYNQWKDGDWGEAVLVSVLGDVIVGLGLQLAFLASVNGYGRDLETEADHGGFRKLAAAGYDVRQAPRLYEILLEGAGGDSGRAENFFFGSHPRLTERIQNARAWVDAHPVAVDGVAVPGDDRLADAGGAEADAGASDGAVAAASAAAAPRQAAAGDGPADGSGAAVVRGDDVVVGEAVLAGNQPVEPTAPAGGTAPVLRGHKGAPDAAAPAGPPAGGTALRPSPLRGEPVGPAPPVRDPLPPWSGDPGPAGGTGEAEFRRHVQPVVVHEARKNVEEGFFGLAEAHLRKALAWNPEDPEAHHALGLLRLAQSREVERGSAEVGPGDARALRDDARRAFLEAIRLAPDLPGPHRELGFLHYDEGTLSDACRELGFYLDLAPAAPDADRVRDHLLDLRRRGAC